MLDIKGWLQRRRYGGITGLNQMDSNFKMLAIGTAPLIIIVLLNNFFIVNTPLESYSWLITIMGLIGELGWIGLLYMRAKAEANGLIVFPQAHIRWPDGSSSWFDLKTMADNIHEICTFPDGSKGYHVQWLDRYEHKDPKMPYPYVFQSMFLRVPAEWADTFERLSRGEVFHGNVFVDHGSCEPTTIWVKEIPETDAGFEPLCYVADSSFQYKQWLNQKQGKAPNDVYFMPFKKAQATNHSLVNHIESIEARLEVAETEKPEDFKRASDDRLEAVRKRHARVMATQEPLISRIFNFKNIAKALIVVGTILVLTHFALGWP